ncbi:MAG TPA: corrinoid protein [Terriglobales bacterium]|nr:corrinoid protein [Terriglobales bacterium]
MSPEMISAMRQSIVEGAPERAAELAREALRNGIAPLDAIDAGYVPGMTEVGDQFAKRKMFLPDMLASAEAMKAAMDVLTPELERHGGQRPRAGTVVLGTTKGDIHEIGKTLVGTLLVANGFEVHDLGVDVSSDKFAAKVREVQADVLGISALLTTTMQGQKSVIETLSREGLRSKVKVIVGGAPVTRRWADEIGADGYGKDAVSAVELVKELVK